MTTPLSAPDSQRVIELFAGPGGWAEGLRLAGYRGASVGLDNSRDACVTAVRAGHARIECDVAAYPLLMFAPGPDGFIASPPCQSFSVAGKRAGLDDQRRVMDLVDLYARGRAAEGEAWADERSRLTAQPMRWIHHLRPGWVACEQVPGVLPLWEHMATRLADLGYSTWTGMLAAEEYGVPQTRRRAFLLASLHGEVAPPAPTHQRYRREGADPASPLPGPVTMAQALGWGLDNRPAWTDTGGGSDTGGAEVFGNAKCRAQLAEIVQRSNYSGSNAGGLTTAEERGRTRRRLDEPSVTLTGRPPQWEIRFVGERPSASLAEVRTVAAPAAPALDAEQGARGGNRSRVTVREAGILQSFRADYPWSGSSKGSQYQQAGNAVPPLLAAAVLGQFVNEASVHRRPPLAVVPDGAAGGAAA